MAVTVTPVPGGPGPAAAGGQASRVVPSPGGPGGRVPPERKASRAPGDPLQAFYENPGVPLSSGPDRARRQARMLAEILRGVAGPAVILDVGCGDGSALAAAAEQRIRPTGSPGSTGPPTPCGRPRAAASGGARQRQTRACRSRTAPPTW